MKYLESSETRFGNVSTWSEPGSKVKGPSRFKHKLLTSFQSTPCHKYFLLFLPVSNVRYWHRTFDTNIDTVIERSMQVSNVRCRYRTFGTGTRKQKVLRTVVNGVPSLLKWIAGVQQFLKTLHHSSMVLTVASYSPKRRRSKGVDIPTPWAEASACRCMLTGIVASPSDGAPQAVPVAKNYRRL